MSAVHNTEIISVGTELLLGHVTNTDARDVSEALARIGINVRYHTVVGDNPGRLKECVKIARSRANIIITTGGLGPTCDDLTKQVLAESFGLELILNETEEQALYDYISPKKKFTQNNLRQAMLPEGCTVFHNSCGTAPGCAFVKDGIIVIMIPGPPKECRTMLEESVIPYLKSLSDETIVSHSVRVFGIGESRVDDIFAREMNAMTNPTMAPYAKECDCLLQITAKAASEEVAEEMCRPVIERVCEKLGDVVYGIDVECVEEAALSCLRGKGLTFALAEGFTGGELAARAAAAAEEGCFKGAFVMPQAQFDAELAAQMAENIRSSLGADTAAAVSGEEKGSFFVALATPDETFVKLVETGAFRTMSYKRRMAGNHAFDMLRRYLSDLEVIA